MVETMKAKTLALALTVVVAAAILSGLAIASAPPQNPLYKGTLDTWYEYRSGESWIPSNAKIVESRWTIIKAYNTIFFKMDSTELNVEEETPGTYDHIVAKMTAQNIQYLGDGIIISGVCTLWKNSQYYGTEEVTVTIEETNYAEQMTFIGFGAKIYGSLLP